MTTKTGFPELERGPLRDVVVSRVQPSSFSEHPEFLYPSVIDMCNLDLYVPIACLYQLDTADPSAFSTFIHCVKNSLSQVLSLYYPMAGKWIVVQDVWIRKLICNDEGAVFVQAAVDEEMDKVIDRHDAKFPEELTGEHAVSGFDPTVAHKTSKTNEFPALIVQVVRFKCGGVAMTLNFNHMTVDGYGFDRFLKAWSEIASTGQTSSKPLFDRSLVVSHLEKSDLLGFPPYSTNLDDTLSDYFKLFRPPTHKRKFTNKLLSIKNETAARLRQEANEAGVSDLPERPERFTTFDCISAQLWRCLARILKALPNSDITSYEKVQLVYPVEGRRRWSNPSLPEDYVGNMFLYASPEFAGSEVADKPLSFAASQIHQSVRNVNHKTSGELLDGMFKMIGGLKMKRELQSTKESEVPTKEPRNEATSFQVVVTAWSRFNNFYNLDFGYGGPFYCFPCPFWMMPYGGVILLPPAPKSSNAVEMFIRGPVEMVSTLCQDSDFIDLVS